MVDVYYDCPCGHRHSQHDWHSGHIPSCLMVDCRCWLYHGHRIGDKPFGPTPEAMTDPTAEMSSDDVLLLAHALLRLASDDGTRVGLDAVLTEYGLTRIELEMEP